MQREGDSPLSSDVTGYKPLHNVMSPEHARSGPETKREEENSFQLISAACGRASCKVRRDWRSLQTPWWKTCEKQMERTHRWQGPKSPKNQVLGKKSIKLRTIPCSFFDKNWMLLLFSSSKAYHAGFNLGDRNSFGFGIMSLPPFFFQTN